MAELATGNPRVPAPAVANEALLGCLTTTAGPTKDLDVCAVFQSSSTPQRIPRMRVPPTFENRGQHRRVAVTCARAECSVRALRLLERPCKPHKLCLQIGARPWAHLARGAN